jgi:hypothetical protein
LNVFEGSWSASSLASESGVFLRAVDDLLLWKGNILILHHEVALGEGNGAEGIASIAFALVLDLGNLSELGPVDVVAFGRGDFFDVELFVGGLSVDIHAWEKGAEFFWGKMWELVESHIIRSLWVWVVLVDGSEVLSENHLSVSLLGCGESETILLLPLVKFTGRGADFWEVHCNKSCHCQKGEEYALLIHWN